jgi:hypothetical protein
MTHKEFLIKRGIIESNSVKPEAALPESATQLPNGTTENTE